MSDAIVLDVLSSSPVQLDAGDADPIARKEIAKLAERVTTVEGDVTALDGRMDAAEGDISTLESDVATLESDVTALGTTVDGIDARVEAIEADYVTSEDVMGALGGEAPTLVSGSSRAMLGDPETASWMERTTAADGAALIEAVRGNTLRWNQLVTFSAGSEVNRGVTFTRSADGTVTANGAATDAVYDSYLNCTIVNSVSSHKYLLRGCPSGGSAGTYYLRDGYNSITETFDTGNGVIISPRNASSMIVQVNIIRNTTVTNLVFHPQLFDLTAMFGAGNEPATVAEFEALFPLPYYPYDAGSLLPVRMEGVETVAADESWSSQRTIPAATYFPQGMRSAGTVYDELTEHEAIHRIGEYTFTGEETWSQPDDGSFYFESRNNSIFASAAQNSYVTATFAGTLDATHLNYTSIRTLDDKRISAQNYTSNGIDISRFWLSKGCGSSVADVQTLTAGKTVHYALTTPTTTPIDPPLNMTYRTAAGGTERVMVPTGEQSAPPTIVAAQGYTAESLRDAALSAIAPVENGKASTNYAVGSYLVHGGQLCKVTTAIARGEAITIGTNVMATTVMAEVLSLIQ